MGMLIEGRWRDEEAIIQNGHFVRSNSVFQERVAAGDLTREALCSGRYHLIASMSCPWSQRTLIFRALKGLAGEWGALPLQVAHGPRVEGYSINGGALWRVPGSDVEIRHLHQLYSLADPAYSGRVTVPLLWDAQEQRIVSNESAEIIRLLDAAEDNSGRPGVTFIPEELAVEISRLNGWLYDNLTNAVYRAGLAQSQAAYDEAVATVFDTLDGLENHLGQRRYLCGGVVTAADWLLFPALVRFDSVYYTHFRCSRRRLVDYPNLWAYTRDLYTWRGVAQTLDLRAIVEGYVLNDGEHNPFGIVPVLPEIDWEAPHGRDAFGPAQVILRDGTLREVGTPDRGLE